MFSNIYECMRWRISLKPQISQFIGNQTITRGQYLSYSYEVNLLQNFIIHPLLYCLYRQFKRVPFMGLHCYSETLHWATIHKSIWRRVVLMLPTEGFQLRSLVTRFGEGLGSRVLLVWRWTLWTWLKILYTCSNSSGKLDDAKFTG